MIRAPATSCCMFMSSLPPSIGGGRLLPYLRDQRARPGSGLFERDFEQNEATLPTTRSSSTR